LGNKTSIHGTIIEYGLNKGESQKKIYAHNEKVITQLPKEDKWPPLNQNMFAFTKSIDTHSLTSYWGRSLHFGGVFKGIEHEWKEWIEKFETLLCDLYWVEAHVHFNPEYYGLVTISWRMDLNKWYLVGDESTWKKVSPEFWKSKIDSDFFESLK